MRLYSQSMGYNDQILKGNDSNQGKNHKQIITDL